MLYILPYYNFMKRTIILLLLAIYSISIRAQINPCSLSIHGKILEASGGKPIEAATVYIKELQKGDHTNATGEFFIYGVCPGNYTLIIQHLHHDPQIEKIDLQKNIQNKQIFLIIR